jgi:hypothetical protein
MILKQYLEKTWKKNNIQDRFHVSAEDLNDPRIEPQPALFQFNLNAGGFKNPLFQESSSPARSSLKYPPAAGIKEAGRTFV